MKTGIFYHKRTGEPVQIVAQAQTKPTFQRVICYQELTAPYEHFVMEQRDFFAEYVKEFQQLPLGGQKKIGKRDDLPDKQPRISKGVVQGDEPDENDSDGDGDGEKSNRAPYAGNESGKSSLDRAESEQDKLDQDKSDQDKVDEYASGGDESMRQLLDFFDAPTYHDKIKILESMKDNLDERMLNNLAVSLDLSIEDGKDGYELIMSELKIRSKYEMERR